MPPRSVPGPGEPERARRTSPSREGVALLVAGLWSGIAAYVFVVVGLRAFGAADFAPISVLWSIWALATAGLSTPVQHWIIQTVRVAGGEGPVRRARLPLFTTVAVVGTVTLVIAFAARVRLFGSSDLSFAVVAGGVVITSGLAGYVRGVLGARRRFVAIAVTLTADGALRVLGLVILVVWGLSAEAAAFLIPAATLVVLAWWSTFRLGRQSETQGRVPRLGGLILTFLGMHLVMNVPPVVAAALDATAVSVSSLFAAFALFRAPFLVTSILATRLSYAFAGLAASDAQDRLANVRNVVLAATVLAAVLGGLLGEWLGVTLLRLVYGPEVALGNLEAPLIVAGSAISLGVLMLVLILTARGCASTAARSLALGILAGGTVLVLVPGEPGLRVAAAFLASQAVAATLLGVADRSHAREPEGRRGVRAP